MTASRRRPTSPPKLLHPPVPRVGLYCRVSSDEQAETDTIQMQLDYLHRYCELNQLQIADIYRDDGVSGTLPLAKRKDGPRLLQDAKSGKFQTVLFMRVNRFA